MGNESNTDDVMTRVASLESDVRNVISAVDNLTNSVRQMSQKVAKGSQTDWGMLAAWATVVITVLGMFGYLTLTPVTEAIGLWSRRQYDHMESVGQLNAAHSERLKALERVVYKEH